MSREIKFRGLSTGTTNWVYGNLLSQGAIGTWGNSTYYTYSQVDPETVGQFTGLLDKNGKEIYEGDVIYNEDEFSCRTSWGDATDESPDKRVVVFQDNESKFNLAYLDEKIRDRGVSGYSFCKANEKLFEVIGNIYENPDLLK